MQRMWRDSGGAWLLAAVAIAWAGLALALRFAVT